MNTDGTHSGGSSKSSRKSKKFMIKSKKDKISPDFGRQDSFSFSRNTAMDGSKLLSGSRTARF